MGSCVGRESLYLQDNLPVVENELSDSVSRASKSIMFFIADLLAVLEIVSSDYDVWVRLEMEEVAVLDLMVIA